MVPEGGQQSYMNTLFDRWQAAAGTAGRLRLQVVDETGQVLRRAVRSVRPTAARAS